MVKVVEYVEGDNIVLTADGAVTARDVIALSGDETGMTSDASDNSVIGVTIQDANDGEKFTVVTEGVVWVVAGSTTVNAGNPVVTAAGGKVDPYDSSVNTPDEICGKAITTATDGPVLIKLGV